LKFKGFIDENGVSVNSLRTGFVNLAKDIVEKVKPILEWTLGVWNKLSTGDLSGAWEDIKKGGSAVTQAVGDFFQSGYDKVTQFGRDVMNPDFGKGGSGSTGSYGGSGAEFGGKSKGGMSLSDFIGKGEGGLNSVNYGERFGYRSGKENLTSMTVGQVFAAQKAMKYNAVGKYQIIRDTMPEVIRGMGLSGKEMFDEKMQDQMGAWLAFHKRSTLGGYLRGKHNNITAAGDDAAREWASLPVFSETLKTGKYHSKRGSTAYSDGVNKASHSVQSTQGTLEAMRARYAELKAAGYSDRDAEYAAFKAFQPKSSQPSVMSGAASSSMNQASNAGRSNNLLASNGGKTVNVNVGEVKVQTTANTIADNVGSAYAGIRNRVTQLETGLV
jgi:hypothetical protein